MKKSKKLSSMSKFNNKKRCETLNYEAEDENNNEWMNAKRTNKLMLIEDDWWSWRFTDGNDDERWLLWLMIDDHDD